MLQQRCGSRFVPRNEPFFVEFFYITKQLAIHIWMGIGHCFVWLPTVRCGGCNFFVNCSVFNLVGNTKTISKLRECNHGSLYVFGAFAAIRDDKFAAFNVRRCCVQAVQTRLDPAKGFQL